MGKIYSGKSYYNGIRFADQKHSLKMFKNNKGEIEYKKWTIYAQELRILYKVPLLRCLLKIINTYTIFILFYMLLDIVIVINRDILYPSFLIDKQYLLMKVISLALGLFVYYTIIPIVWFKFTKKGKVTAKYHGAEHMVIRASEKEIPLTIENVRKCSRVSRYCSTNLMVICNILKAVIFSYILIYAGLPSLSISFIISKTLGEELFLFKNAHKIPILNIIFKLGDWQQRFITTARPDDEHLLLAIKGMSHLKSLSQEVI